jgi:hypothetical protein
MVAELVIAVAPTVPTAKVTTPVWLLYTPPLVVVTMPPLLVRPAGSTSVCVTLVAVTVAPVLFVVVTLNVWLLPAVADPVVGEIVVAKSTLAWLLLLSGVITWAELLVKLMSVPEVVMLAVAFSKGTSGAVNWMVKLLLWPALGSESELLLFVATTPVLAVYVMAVAPEPNVYTPLPLLVPAALLISSVAGSKPVGRVTLVVTVPLAAGPLLVVVTV